MYEDHVAAGFRPDDFWRLTLRLWFAQMRGAAQRADRENRRDVILAWTVAALSRVDKMPTLNQMLDKASPAPPRQAPEVLSAMGAAMARAWGAKEVAA